MSPLRAMQYRSVKLLPDSVAIQLSCSRFVFVSSGFPLGSFETEARMAISLDILVWWTVSEIVMVTIHFMVYWRYLYDKSYQHCSGRWPGVTLA